MILKKFSKNKLASNIALFSIFNSINSAIPIILLPILTNYLAPEGYGIIDIFTNSQLFLTPAISLMITAAVNRLYFDKTLDFQRVVSSAIAIVSLLFFVILTISSFLNSKFINAFELNVEYNFLTYIIIYTYCIIIFELKLVIWRIKMNVLKYGIFRILKTFIEIGITLYLIVKLDFDFNGRIIAMIATSILFLLLSYFLIFKEEKITVRIDKKYMKILLTYSLPIIFHSYGAMIINYSDRFFLAKIIGIREVGIYAVAYQIGMGVSLLQNSINQAYGPYLFSLLNAGLDDNIKSQIKKHFKFYVIGMIIFTSVIMVIANVLFDLIFSEDYSESKPLIIIILIAFFFNSIYRFFVHFLFFDKNTKILALTTAAVATFNLVSNFFLITEYHALGAAISTLLSYLLLAIVTIIIANNKFLIFKKL